MPSVGRKFLLAGRGGLNLTHAEAITPFLSRYGARQPQIARLLADFGPEALREWVHGLGIDTFVGTSGRVFPTDMKAAPLLRAWLHRLRNSGVQFHMRHRWLGWCGTHQADGDLHFSTPAGPLVVRAEALVLALGGASWARLGSDGAWVPLLAARGVEVAPLRPSNCGFDVGWSAHFRSRFAGHPLKSVALAHADSHGVPVWRNGQFAVTENGVEGSLIYAVSAALRDEIAATGSATIWLDLAPGKSVERLVSEIAHPRGARSMGSHLQSRAGIDGVKAGLLRECVAAEVFADPSRLAAAIKALPVKLIAARPLDEAISTAGGVAFEGLDGHAMAKAVPGLFCAGEMLDWEAPTGGYLLTACLASGRAAGLGALSWVQQREA